MANADHQNHTIEHHKSGSRLGPAVPPGSTESLLAADLVATRCGAWMQAAQEVSFPGIMTSKSRMSTDKAPLAAGEVKELEPLYFQLAVICDAYAAAAAWAIEMRFRDACVCPVASAAPK